MSRFSGNFEHTFETTIAGVTIQAPQLDVNTVFHFFLDASIFKVSLCKVAAGGGSMLFFRSGIFAVGPDSAGLIGSGISRIHFEAHVVLPCHVIASSHRFASRPRLLSQGWTADDHRRQCISGACTARVLSAHFWA